MQAVDEALQRRIDDLLYLASRYSSLGIQLQTEASGSNSRERRERRGKGGRGKRGRRRAERE